MGPLTTTAIVFDVDGVVSPVHPVSASPWGDEHVVGQVFGPPQVSRRLCKRLDAMNRPPDVQCWWLTSWTDDMRAAMTAFPGRTWPTVAAPTRPRRGAGHGGS